MCVEYKKIDYLKICEYIQKMPSSKEYIDYDMKKLHELDSNEELLQNVEVIEVPDMEIIEDDLDLQDLALDFEGLF